MPYENAAGYAGDLPATEAFQLLVSDGASVLIDVRTRAEWAFVGTPDLNAIGKSVLFLEWQTFPSMQAVPDFAARLAAELAAAGVQPGAPLLFLCRSGARSRSAAIAMTRAGWAPCLNVSDGFEGPLDSRGRRNLVGGWRAGDLPWAQT
ncbi:thiosulfate sulfurtransferase [Roseiarcus fermentans]|uniref:Thiosulfate sulfurtransferase n=1 Tax=Roseiarcus fermentans TaxID=1473586 RepID=A0A366EEF7_9HYPH|nr:rhodanese-like domain-containing protein [Roseiarcus fermentans]RBP00794.1 thiosulfate sulfurtransferase [Roseiarcus fermentans]